MAMPSKTSLFELGEHINLSLAFLAGTAENVSISLEDKVKKQFLYLSPQYF